MYTVIIKKKHCEETFFMNCDDCALARAIKEQIPSFPFFGAGGTSVLGSKDEILFFNSSYETGWCRTRFDQLLNGEINSFRVTLHDDIKKLNSEPLVQECDASKDDSSTKAGSIKVVTKYVGVPVSIGESLPETILS